jgi:hypothetical protein
LRIASGGWSRCHRRSSCPALSPSCRRGSTCGLDRVGGRAELVRGDVCDDRRLAGSVGGMACRPTQVAGRSHCLAARRASLGHRDLATCPGAGLLNRLTRSPVLRPNRLEPVQDVRGARCRPQGQELVIRIVEGPTAAGRHDGRGLSGGSQSAPLLLAAAQRSPTVPGPYPPDSRRPRNFVLPTTPRVAVLAPSTAVINQPDPPL